MSKREEADMQQPNQQPRKDSCADRESSRGLYDLMVDVSQLALALARTYERRPPPLAKRGRLHAV